MNGNGTCGATSYGGDCNVAPKGAWHASAFGITTLAQCVAHAKGCKMAEYISFGPVTDDCSWFSECDMSHLCEDCHTCGIGCPKYYPYTSAKVKSGPSPSPPGPPPPPPPPITVSVAIDWGSAPLTTASTAATVELDCCEPFLTRDPAAHTNGGGPFSSYFSAMKAMGAEFVRFAPWYPYPKIAVVELEPPDCTASKPATNWNSSLFDPILEDFMLAVCGDDAINGKCEHSVAQQLSTMPSWLYVDGADPATLPADPWAMRMTGYSDKGTALKNESCTDMAAYIGRMVEHYTAGGHHDSCGHFHPSGFHFNWTIVSILNENERNTGGPRYTTCFDAIRAVVEKINPSIVLEGPETVFMQYTPYFIDPQNHKDGRAPDLVSNHADWNSNAGAAGEGYESLFDGVDKFVAEQVTPLAALRDKVAPHTELALNEWIPFIDEWCDASDAAALFAEHAHNTTHPLLVDTRSQIAGCPNWQDPRASTMAVGINRATLGWSATAAQFAYGVGMLALHGNYKYVGNDDLACGPYPDNEPAVTGIDWQTGDWNAKTFVLKMLAENLGAGPKDLLPAALHCNTTTPPPPPPGGCFTDKGHSYKFAPGNVFSTPNHGVKLTDSAAQCCALCQSFKNCTLWTWEHGGTAAKPTCYSDAGACCFLKTAAAASARAPNSASTSGSTKEIARAGALFALPFIMHDAANTRRLMLVNKRHTPLVVTIEQDAGALATAALVVEGVGPEPGFNKPTKKMIASDGKLEIGPYGVALITMDQ